MSKLEKAIAILSKYGEPTEKTMYGKLYIVGVGSEIVKGKDNERLEDLGFYPSGMEENAYIYTGYDTNNALK